VAVKPQKCLAATAQLAKLSKHQRHSVLDTLVGVLGHGIASVAHIPRREHSIQLTPARLGLKTLLQAHPQHLELDHTKSALDAQHELVIEYCEVIQLVCVTDQRTKDLTDLEQLTPVSVGARQPRHLATEHQAHFAQRHSADQTLKTATRRCPDRGADTEVGVDELNVAKSQLPSPIHQRILQVLKQEGILKTLDKGGGRKAAVLAFSQLLNIAEGHKAF